MNKKYRNGFTLIELILYTAVFGVVSGLLTTILITSTRITTTQTVSTQVSNELNLVLTTVQSLVRSSSNIECVSSSNCTVSSGSYLKLRFQDPALDPTCIYLSGTAILVARGPDATNNQNCTTITQALTTSKVNVNSLTFTKFDIPGGKATVQIDATLTYNSTNPDLQISRTLRSAIGRVSAATFDSDLLPDATNSRSIGNISTPRAWRNVFLSGVLGLGTATNAGETGMTATTGAIYYNTTAPATVKVYNGTTWQEVGGSQTPWTANVNAANFTLSGDSIASGILRLDSTSHATKGYVLLNPTGGNVGIGVATPGAKLDVAGGVKLANDTATCESTKAGTMRWSGTKFEVCTGAAWVSFIVAHGVATGGIGAATDITDGVAYKLLTFTSSGTLTVTTAGLFDVLLVGGGGEGGSGVGYNGEGGGGGGGGAVISFTTHLNAGEYTVTVGIGGTGTAGDSINGKKGGNSAISTIRTEAVGGQGGGQSWGGGVTGYNSGGASYRGGYGGNPAKASDSIYGFAGGASTGSGDNGGGGGSGGAGGTRTAGIGLTKTFTGSSVTFGAGGLGGGTSGSAAVAGAANTGNGGGGAISTAAGAAGGSGVVYVRFKP